jgi:hypothetical protein
MAAAEAKVADDGGEAAPDAEPVEPPAAPPVAMERERARQVIERLVALVGELTDATAAAAGDCPAMAGAIEGWGQRNVAELRELVPVLDSAGAGLSDQENREIEQRLAPKVEQLSSVLAPCLSDEQVLGALNRISDEVGKGPDAARSE